MPLTLFIVMHVGGPQIVKNKKGSTEKTLELYKTSDFNLQHQSFAIKQNNTVEAMPPT